MLAIVALMLLANVEESTTGFIDKRYTAPDGHVADYVVYIPKDYNPSKKYPVILFLHGGGETKGEGGENADRGRDWPRH